MSAVRPTKLRFSKVTNPDMTSQMPSSNIPVFLTILMAPLPSSSAAAAAESEKDLSKTRTGRLVRL